MGDSKHPLTFAERFAQEFFSLVDLNLPPRYDDYPGWTSWFEKQMQLLASAKGKKYQELYCQNKRKGEEWMNIDHVFVPLEKRYDQFPLIAVEHENGNCSFANEGVAPPGSGLGGAIGWAAWKVLAMQADLHVLVAYPRAIDHTRIIQGLTEMLGGWHRQFGIVPNALFLLGWWRDSNPTSWSSNDYKAYKAGSESNILTEILNSR